MILEAVMLQVKPGQETAYEAAFREASPLIAAIPGYISHELQRCIEAQGKYLLLVQWETLEAHTVNFRGSEYYQQWKALLHHFYDPFPTVEHFQRVNLNLVPAYPVSTEPRIRVATMDDIPALQMLIEVSVRGLNSRDYPPDVIDSSLKYVFGVDTQLILDGTYFAVEAGGQIVGCGGWSKRKTLYGGDQAKEAEDNLLDPAVDAARIRAFFVHPNYSRRGIGRLIMTTCEDAARAVGFTRLELMATLTGIPLYEASGFVVTERLVSTLPDGAQMPLARMAK